MMCEALDDLDKVVDSIQAAFDRVFVSEPVLNKRPPFQGGFRCYINVKVEEEAT